jgi:ubiquinone/menaquinone biosynthesis C-methylase UbiE
MESHPYDSWAAIYDSVYSYVQEDIPFYLNEAIASKGPVLELGCGTGRVTIPIAEAGVPITGLDFSEAMLDVARKKTESISNKDHVRLALGDMTDFDLEEKFALIIIPFRGFQALLSVEDEISALDSIKRHLAPGGKLIFNIFVPDVEMLVQPFDVTYHFRDVFDPKSGIQYVLWNQTDFDSYRQVMNIRTTIEELDDDSVVVRKMYRDFQLRNVFRWEMHHLLNSSGFHVEELFGDFDGSEFDEASTEMIWIASVAD